MFKTCVPILFQSFRIEDIKIIPNSIMNKLKFYSNIYIKEQIKIKTTLNEF